MGAARDLLKLINHKGLPPFNPLVGNNHENPETNQSNNGKINSQKSGMKQQSNFIMQ